jgi:hypothetical protein
LPMPLMYSPKVSPSRLRKPVDTDRLRIYCQIEKARQEVAGSDITKLSNAAYATEMIVQGGVDSVILDEAYLVVYSVGQPWYSDRIFLQENMVLRIGEGSNFSAVCDLLDDLAQHAGANDILVGGALAKYPRALIRLYKSRGYELLTSPSLIKRR